MLLAVTDDPPICYSTHNIGRMVLTVWNHGIFGIGPHAGYLTPDCVTGEYIVRGSEFPKGHKRRYLEQGGIWVGRIIGDDTLVTTILPVTAAREVTQLWVNGKAVDHRTVLDSFDLEYRDAVSEQDLIVAYIDTIIRYIPFFYDDLDHRPHKPLHLKINQESYAWSYSYAGDIIFFNMNIQNIGSQTIRDAYIGIYIWPQVVYTALPDDSLGEDDDLCGFLKEYKSKSTCGFIDTINIAWAADNDGDPFSGEWIDEPFFNPVTQSSYASIRGVLGVKVLSQQDGYFEPSFNWWKLNFADLSADYGPMQKSKYRNYHTGNQGTPLGDRNLYYVMSNGEIDFDQQNTAIINQGSDWIVPIKDVAQDLADGANSEFVLSLGPFDIPPQSSLPFVFCVVAGENLHVDPTNGDNLPHNPYKWYANLDFSHLVKNAMWAEKIYDNPGVDTDGDGYAGEFRVCNLESAFVGDEWIYTYADTQWYKGDGVPDWRAAGPPTPPDYWLTPIHNGIHVRFNGQVTETTPDIMTQKIDFEGYRIYLGRDSRESSYSLVASYDLEDYDKYFYNLKSGLWEINDDPFTLKQLRCLYGAGVDPCIDSTFDPLFYTRTRIYEHPNFPDSIFFFTKHDFNVSELGIMTTIRKRFPDAIDPTKLPADSLTDDMYTDDGYFKYFEYEFEITGLLPTVAYWVNVTAFDFGSPESGLQPLETSVTLNAKSAFPLHDLDAPLSGSDKIYVYPNPYRINGGYRSSGYEGRDRGDLPNDKVRAVWFANLPPKCTITIFTIDGDRVRTLEHDMDVNDPTYSHHRWDLISRNYQRIVSGLYYWTVETPDRETQMGKLVVIR